MRTPMDLEEFLSTVVPRPRFYKNLNNDNNFINDDFESFICDKNGYRFHCYWYISIYESN